ncbi:MAG: tRNA uridine-5-carboxymethylaminomethyl(34) synthesis enzyme MnmG [Kiritimatiellae bacterium]|nr:tRNA uridine-5-carboxymethylaminomethyl(34) synthesis enzyme MnmG [Kiritimatiellia bacterium]
MTNLSKTGFDIVVVGAGHAGCEAALAAARMGADTALISFSIEAAARMSCNPSIGGIAKSHMVFELDALGGEMARNTDATGLQFRVLNTRKGPAVQANRAQCDKAAYAARMVHVLRATANLALLEDDVTGVLVENDCITGVRTLHHGNLSAKKVILTAGTFLKGRIFVGKDCTPGGRIGEDSEETLSGQLKDIGFEVSRMKTGTPPRLKKESLHYDKMVRQDGFNPPPFFSFEAREAVDALVPRGTLNDVFPVPHASNGDSTRLAESPVPRGTSENDFARTAPFSGISFGVLPFSHWKPGSGEMPCFLTHTTPKTMEIIRSHLKDSALYGGLIEVGSPRYCPSIEDKVVKFPGREEHHVFIEPEGRDAPQIYPNGTSNSLPLNIQVEMIHSIPGLEDAEFFAPGYAIEYDFFPPTQLRHSLETKKVEGLYFAGQINGTTGYEEAAVQGFMAGVNAARSIGGLPPLVFARHEAYIGVLIDDLVTKGTNEPYRMFTSRAEHRLLLRQDNAIFRLRNAAKEIGIVDKGKIAKIQEFLREIDETKNRLHHTKSGGITIAKRILQSNTDYATMREIGALPSFVRQEVLFSLRYAGYIEREERKIASARNLEETAIPQTFDFMSLAALRYEAREKLSAIRPATLGQASRISGVTPADIAILAVWLKRAGT